MRQYVYGFDGEEVKLILDHNKTARVTWNSTVNNSDGPVVLMSQLETDTKNWKIEAPSEALHLMAERPPRSKCGRKRQRLLPFPGNSLRREHVQKKINSF